LRKIVLGIVALGLGSNLWGYCPRNYFFPVECISDSSSIECSTARSREKQKYENCLQREKMEQQEMQLRRMQNEIDSLKRSFSW
jgi:hypothetical protein